MASGLRPDDCPEVDRQRKRYPTKRGRVQRARGRRNHSSVICIDRHHIPTNVIRQGHARIAYPTAIHILHRVICGDGGICLRLIDAAVV